MEELRQRLLATLVEIQSLTASHASSTHMLEMHSRWGLSVRPFQAMTGDRQVKEAIQLLQHIIHSSQQAARGHTRAIWGVLHPLTTSAAFTPAVRAYTLDVLGELALACGDAAAFDMDACILLFYTVLREQTISARRRAAVQSLGHVIQGTSYPAQARPHAPELLRVLGDMLKVEQGRDFRVTVLKTMGVIGAIDPIYVEQSRAMTEVDDSSSSSSQNNKSSSNSAGVGAGRAGIGGAGAGAGVCAGVGVGGVGGVGVGVGVGAGMSVTGMGSVSLFGPTVGKPASAQVEAHTRELAAKLLFSELDLHDKKGTDHFCIASAVNALVRVALDPALMRLHQYVMRAYTVLIKSVLQMDRGGRSLRGIILWRR